MVVIIVSLLVLGGVVVRGAARRDRLRVPVERGGNGLRWLWIGVGVSSRSARRRPGLDGVGAGRGERADGQPAVVIEVTGQQWWWKARYLTAIASRVFTTANEIHIPSASRCRSSLIGADVIHSFWVPRWPARPT